MTNQTSAGEVEHRDADALFDREENLTREDFRAAFAAIRLTADREGWTRCQGEAAAKARAYDPEEWEVDRDQDVAGRVSREIGRDIADIRYTPPSHAAEPIEVEACPECRRSVLISNKAASGFLATCGRRVASVYDCIPGGCSAAKADAGGQAKEVG